MLCFMIVYNKENLERQETNKYGRGTVRHLPKTDESVAKTYRDETKTKMNISARSQWPTSAVEYCILSNAHPRAGRSSRQS